MLSRQDWISIQILRGIAAFAVVVHHVPQYLGPHGTVPAYVLESGAAGVDVFFVISGFVMHAATAGKSVAAGEFFLKRLARILPIYWLLTTALFFATVVMPSAFGSFTATPSTWLKSLFFIPSFNGEGYIRPLLAVGWTLHFELFFYAMLTLSLFVATRHQTLLAVLSIASLCAIVAASGISLIGSPLQLLAPITLEFCAGVLIASVICSQKALVRLEATPWIALVGLALAIASLGFLREDMSSDLGFRRIGVWGLGAVFLTVGVLLAEPMLRTLSNRLGWMRGLGDASYSLYLIHGLVFSIAWKLLPGGLKHNAWIASIWLATLPLLICWPFHKCVEVPLNQRALRVLLGLRDWLGRTRTRPQRS